MKFINIFCAALLCLLVTAYPKEGNPCLADEDCMQSFELCSMKTQMCIHKSLLPINKQEIGGYVVLILAILFSNAGGLGGGGIVVPILLFFFNFKMKQAVAQSNASIAICGMIRLVFNSQKPHPLKEGKGLLVDYSQSSLILPGLVVGATVGVMINNLLPEVIIVAGFTSILMVMSVVTLRKLIHIISHDKAQ